MQKLLSGAIAPDLENLVILGINHEQQHQELLLTDLKYAFALNPIGPVYQADANLVAAHNTSNGWLQMSEGLYEIGYAGDNFCFDNELGRHKQHLVDYEISRALVTNGEFLEFVQSGGYSDFRHWLDDGWSWVCEYQVKCPLYWRQIDGVWHQYTLAGLQPLDLDAILGHISFYEANAFACWAGKRLPSEFEWEAAANQLDWGKRWEWTGSAYLPFPGFRISEGAVGEYNGKFMINQMVLRGSSVATPSGHSRTSYRNFFHPHLQWQYSGIRLAR